MLNWGVAYIARNPLSWARSAASDLVQRWPDRINPARDIKDASVSVPVQIVGAFSDRLVAVIGSPRAHP